MTKQEFLEELKQSLSGQVSSEAMMDAYSYYSGYIEDAVRKGKTEEEVIEELAKWFKCGTTVIARRAYDQAFIDYATYLKIAKKAVQFYLDHKNKNSGGGDYYRTAASRIDRRFFDLLIGSVHEGRTLYSDAFRLTNTNRSTFATLAEKMGGVI